MHAAQRLRSHDDGMGSQLSGNVVPLIGALRDQLVQVQNVRTPERGSPRPEALSDPVLGDAGVPHLPLLRRGVRGLRRIAGQQIHLLLHFGFGQRVAFEGGRSVNGPDAVQPIELRLPVGRQHQIECGFLGGFDPDQIGSQIARLEPIVETKFPPVHQLFLTGFLTRFAERR